jgi:hypothetical protein
VSPAAEITIGAFIPMVRVRVRVTAGEFNMAVTVKDIALS